MIELKTLWQKQISWAISTYVTKFEKKSALKEKICIWKWERVKTLFTCLKCFDKYIIDEEKLSCLFKYFLGWIRTEKDVRRENTNYIHIKISFHILILNLKIVNNFNPSHIQQSCSRRLWTHYCNNMKNIYIFKYNYWKKLKTLCGNWRICSFLAISPFVTMFLKVACFRGVGKRLYGGKG